MILHASLRDAGELKSALGQGFEIDVVQLQRGDFASRLLRLELPGVALTWGSLTRTIEIAGVARQQLNMLATRSCPRPLVLNGRTLEPENLVAASHGREHRFVVPAAFEGLVMEFSDPIIGKASLPADLVLGQARPLVTFAGTALRQAAFYRSEASRRGLAARSIELLLRSLPVSEPDRSRSEWSGARRRAALRAADLIHQNPREPLTLGLLCQHAHVSERTLRSGFADLFGMGPNEYVRVVRLNRVRRRLQEASPCTTTVTEVAMEWGFWQMAHFASYYRGFFGELPSETLRGPASTLTFRGWSSPSPAGLCRRLGSSYPDVYPESAGSERVKAAP